MNLLSLGLHVTAGCHARLHEVELFVDNIRGIARACLLSTVAGKDTTQGLHMLTVV